MTYAIEFGEETKGKVAEQKERLEREMLKEFGILFNFEVVDSKMKNGCPVIEFSQKNVMTGNQLGILGNAIFTVGCNITLMPYETEKGNRIWVGSVYLTWEHQSGGSNGSRIGQVTYHADEYNHDFGFGSKPGKFEVMRTRG